MSDLHLSDARYLAVLRRQRDRIAAGAAFVAVDSDTTGNKHTHASWGLCSEDADAWPDADDHLWPDQFAESRRVAPKYRHAHQVCPMQRKGGPHGCFYSCEIFKHRAITRNKRDQAVALYDARIAKAAGGE